jgi:hypothetical protein
VICAFAVRRERQDPRSVDTAYHQGGDEDQIRLAQHRGRIEEHGHHAHHGKVPHDRRIRDPVHANRERVQHIADAHETCASEMRGEVGHAWTASCSITRSTRTHAPRLGSVVRRCAHLPEEHAALESQQRQGHAHQHGPQCLDHAMRFVFGMRARSRLVESRPASSHPMGRARFPSARCGRAAAGHRSRIAAVGRASVDE